MSDKYNPYIFENKDLWENYDESGEIKKKLPLIFENIPNDVVSIIDVGCGNGEITNQFPTKYKILGVDNSKEALKHVKKNKLNCSAESIPVEDKSFDMVFSSELIEHLPEEIMIATLEEFKRIARKYIFITVPNHEQLKQYLIKCPKCNSTFHSYGHLNSFTSKKIKRIIGTNFKILWTTTSGKYVKEYNNLLLKLRHKLAQQYFAPTKYTVCPFCQNKDFPPQKGTFLSKIINGINLFTPRKKKKYWLFVLFERI